MPVFQHDDGFMTSRSCRIDLEAPPLLEIEWTGRRNPAPPYPVTEPGALEAVSCSLKDSKRCPETSPGCRVDNTVAAPRGKMSASCLIEIPAFDAANGFRVQSTKVSENDSPRRVAY